MKRFAVLFLTLALLVLVCQAALAASAPKATNSSGVEVVIKGHRFGDAKEAILAAEGEPEGTGIMDGTGAEYVYYSTTVVGLKAYLVYYFTDDRVCEFRYVLTEEHSNNTLFLDDYQKIRDALISKYGEPVALLSGEKWDNSDHQEYYSDNRGDALNYGYLTFTDWFTAKDADIAMHMSADNYEVSTTISYTSSVIKMPDENYDGDI